MHNFHQEVDNMQKKRIFIDGREGTTGLRIYDRISTREDIEMIILPEEKRKDTEARREALNSCDIAFLCLPDAAAVEAVSLISNPGVTVIDTSTAHRTAPGWTYGFPELDGQREKIKASKRIANPGCHASGFISLVAPLVKAGILSPADCRLVCTSVTGYSGGGKKMIALYESEDRSVLYDSPRQYALTQQHKHLKEMKTICGIDSDPVFEPIVSGFYSGMAVTVPLFRQDLKNGADIEKLKEIFSACYKGPVVTFTDNVDDDGFFSANALSGKDSMEITVSGNEDRILLLSRYDNLGKGASGSAIQNMNIILGTDETTGLNI